MEGEEREGEGREIEFGITGWVMGAITDVWKGIGSEGLGMSGYGSGTVDE